MPVSTAAALFDIAGRTIIVTGASSGLGARFAAVFHAGGAHVVAAARRADRLAELAAQMPGIRTVACDVTEPGDRSRLVGEALQWHGSVDVLVNCAGMTGPSVPAERFDPDRWDRTIATNLTGAFALSCEVARPMLEAGRGSIIQIGSVLGLVAGAPMMDAAYAASKGAIVNLTRELAAEWAPRGVRVNAVAPGWFRTEMTQEMTDEASERYVARGCPIRRWGRDDELDGIVLYLASDASTYCVGQTFAIDGGWTIR
jgi:hypothetical protein